MISFFMICLLNSLSIFLFCLIVFKEFTVNKNSKTVERVNKNSKTVERHQFITKLNDYMIVFS